MATENINAKTNLRRKANQAEVLGNTLPPNMANVNENMLKRASPASFSLLNTKYDRNPSDAAVASCRTYTDVTGLRRLQREQVNRTHHEPACGWRYRPSNGIAPEINQAAAGSANGPLYGHAGAPDEVTGGTRWYWNLNDAERDISTAICQSASRCNQLSLLGQYADVCGYCKTSGQIIPIQNGSARYPMDPTFGCEEREIVTSTAGTCEGFAGQSFGSAGGRRGMPNRGDLNEAFKLRGSSGFRSMGSEGFRPVSFGSEAFANLDSLDNCTDSPLSRDCVVLAAQAAGCANEGTLITALQGIAPGSDYDSVLKTNPVYTSYKSVAAPGITSATLKDGSVALQTALDDFTGLMRNTQASNRKLALSATDLCKQKGAFDEYDFCSEMTPATIINTNTLGCVEQAWLNKGGTAQGTGYPKLDYWSGKTYQQFLNTMDSLIRMLNSPTKNTNVAGLKRFFGTESAGPPPTVPKNDNTRGAETVWFDFQEANASGKPPVILRCDLRLAKNGEVMPFFTSAAELTSKYRLTTSEAKAYTTTFEVRSDTDRTMKFNMVTDDGTMISVNQNPYEETTNRINDWGSWKFQTATTYDSPEYTVNAERSGRTNTVVIKWFSSGGGATSQINMQFGSTNWKSIATSEVYLTQEPLAPWLQYEVCTRPNNGNGNANGFFEKRFNGQIAIQYPSNAKFPGFDVTATSLTIQTDTTMRRGVPKGLPYISFTGSSSWSTMSAIHVNAIRTITILVRPTATLSSGQQAPIFNHGNSSSGTNTFNAGCEVLNNGGNYTLTFTATAFGRQIGSFSGPISMNEWNLIVLQYIGEERGLRKITCHVQTLERLQDPGVITTFSAALTAVQGTGGIIVAGKPDSNSIENSGIFRLGNQNRQGFTGDVAWIHGFRNFLDTPELLQSEVQQTWISRWSRGNLDSEPQPRFM